MKSSIGSGGLDWTVRPGSSALLVIDMQNDFVREGGVMEVPLARKCLPNIRRLLEAARGSGIPVVFASDANGGLDEPSHAATLESISRAFGRVASTREILQEIEAAVG